MNKRKMKNEVLGDSKENLCLSFTVFFMLCALGSCKHRWCVGIMTEMAPVGYVGVSPKCILGFNKNQGEEICLRLRTDVLKGFRKYESIKKLFYTNLLIWYFLNTIKIFYALDKQLNEEIASLDWTKSRGHTLSGIRHSENSEEDYYVENGVNSQKVGGNMSTLLENTSANVEASETHDEPDPDDSTSVIHDEDEKLDIPSQIRALGKHAYELDPDDLADNQNKFDPDPDDLLHGETLQPKHHSDSAQNSSQTNS